jgi:hypothetical protein
LAEIGFRGPTVNKRTIPNQQIDPPLKQQAQCGSCWAFATTGTLEGAWFVHTGQGRSFSEQQLVDCAWDEVGRVVEFCFFFHFGRGGGHNLR